MPTFSFFNLIFVASLFLAGCASSNKDKNADEVKADLYYSYGTSHLIEKNYTEALDMLLKAEKLDAKNSKIQNNLGMAYYFKGQTETAINHISRAIELDSKNSDARNNLASIYFGKGDFKKAREQYQMILTDLVYTHQYRTYYNLALIKIKEGSHREATEYLNKSVSLREDYCPAHFKLGEIAKNLQSYNKALDHFKRSSEGVCHNFPAPIYETALIQFRLGKQDIAISKLENLIERFPKSEYATLATVKLKSIKETDKPEPMEVSKKTNTTKNFFKKNEDHQDFEIYESPDL